MKLKHLIVLLMCGITMAQPMGPMSGGSPVGDRHRFASAPGNGPMAFQRMQMQRGPREHNREQISMMMMWRMTEELSLTEEQAAVLFPKLKKHRDEMEQIDSELKELSVDIRNKIEKDEKITDKYFENSLKKMNDLGHKRVDAKTAFLKSVKGTLSNEQVIKLSTFEQRFKREIKQKMQESRLGKGGNR